MVKQGHFELVLVRADEKGAAFEEHSAPGGGGNVFAEVEPDAEFYLQLSSDAPEVVYADLRVDGQLIKKGHRVKTGGRTSKVGVIRSDESHGEGMDTEVALRFARAEVHAFSYFLPITEAEREWELPLRLNRMQLAHG